MKKKCINCGKELSQGAKYRCWQCYTKNNKGANNSNWKGGSSKKYCGECGKPIKNYYAKWCKKCSYKYKNYPKKHSRKKYIITKNGYALIRKPEHPLSFGGYIPRSRLVIEKYLRKINPKSKFLIKINGELYLSRKFIVHHRGTKYLMSSIKNRSDDRIENLKVVTNKEHHSIHWEGENNPNYKDGRSKNKKEYLKIYKRTWNKKKWKDPKYREKERKWAKISYERRKGEKQMKNLNLNKKYEEVKADYELGIAICNPSPHFWKKKKLHRYFAVGIQNKKGFTGLVHDYEGGGEYSEHLFLDGKSYWKEENDEQENRIEKKYPHLLKQIYNKINKFAKYDKKIGTYIVNKKFDRKYKEKVKGNEVYREGIEIDLKEVGNTFFRY